MHLSKPLQKVSDEFHLMFSHFYLEGKVICHHPFIRAETYGLLLVHALSFMESCLYGVTVFMGNTPAYNTFSIIVTELLKTVEQFISDLSGSLFCTTLGQNFLCTATLPI